MRLLIPSIISKHPLLHVNGLKSDQALYKVWHIAAKLSHETNLAITKLSLSLIHNIIGLGLPMFVNATTRQQISICSVGPYWYLLACTPHLEKSEYRKIFFRSLRSRIPVCTPTLKSAAAPMHLIYRLFVNHHLRSAQVWHVSSGDFTVLPAHPHVHPHSAIGMSHTCLYKPSWPGWLVAAMSVVARWW